MAYYQPRVPSGYAEPLSYHTWNLAKVIYFTAAMMLIITGIQDYLDPGRRQLPAVNLKALTSISLGFFMLYLFFTVLNTPRYYAGR